MARTERAILAGGCFWGVQDLLRKMPGVISTRTGYSGGDVPNATYRNHGTHAEAVEIVFDPEQLSYRQLLEFFFQIHDPSTLNRLGHDRGSATRRRRDDRRRQRVGYLAWQGRHRSQARRPILGSGARTSGLS